MSEVEHSEIDFALIGTRFPKQFDRIQHLMQFNQDFESVCEEYCIAYKTMRRMESNTSEKWKIELAEYRELIQELGAEIAEMLLQGESFARNSRLNSEPFDRE